MPTTRRADGRLRRRAASKAPASDPTATRVTRSPYAWAPRWNSCCAINTLIIWKFKPKVPTKNTTHMTSTMFGLLRMYVQSLPDLPLCPRAGRGGAEQSAVHHHESADKGRVAERIDQNCPPRSDCCDHEPSERGTDDPRGMKCRRVEPDRVRKVIGTSNLGYEALPCRVVKRGAKTERERDHIDVLGRREAGHRQYAECCRAERQPRLSHLENLLLVESVRDEAAVRRKQQHRQELQAGCNADREGRAAGKLEHQPVLRYALHPGTDIGDE